MTGVYSFTDDFIQYKIIVQEEIVYCLTPDSHICIGEDKQFRNKMQSEVLFVVSLQLL